MLVHYAMRSSRWPDLLHYLKEFARCRAPGIYKQSYVDRARDPAERPPRQRLSRWRALVRELTERK